MSNNICLSGGANGSDVAWGKYASQIGHKVVHFSFQGHRTDAPAETLIRLSTERLEIADPFLQKANKILKRHLPYDKPWIMNLLRRNYYQIKDSESLYAIGTFKNHMIDGGTAWAVVLFQLERLNLPCFFFDQFLKQWFGYDGQWDRINTPTKPSGVWTGIGTRALNEYGETAIKNLLVKHC